MKNEEEQTEEQSKKDEEIPLNGSDMRPRTPTRIWLALSLTVEPILFVLNFVLTFTSGVSIDLLQNNVCYQHFNLSWEECMNMGQSGGGNVTDSIKSSVEAMTADVNMINNEIQSAFPVVLSLFIGPWSDTNGRKPFIKWALMGYTAFYCLWGILSMIKTIPVMYFVIPAIPLSLSGGFIAILVCTWSYVADVYQEQDRPYRLSVLLCIGLIGSVLGNALSAKVFYASGSFGYQVVFFSAAVLSAAVTYYATYVLKESVIIRQEGNTKFFDFKHLKSIFVALLIRPKHKVIISILTMTILASEITANSGDKEMVYLVGKSSFNWTLGDYNLFSAIVTILSAVSPVIGVKIFNSLLHWSNYAILAVFSAIMLTMNVMKATAANQTMFWVAACSLKLSSLLGPYIDTEVSKIVHEKDLGKAYAFSSLVDALSPLISLPVFTALYKYLLAGGGGKEQTLKVFFMKAGLSTITLVSSTTLYVLFKYYRKRFWNLENSTSEQKEKRTSQHLI